MKSMRGPHFHHFVIGVEGWLHQILLFTLFVGQQCKTTSLYEKRMAYSERGYCGQNERETRAVGKSK